MRIALVTHNVIRGDGQGRVNLEVARRAVDAGHEVVLLTDQVDPTVVDAGARWVPVHPAVERPNLLKVVSFASRADRALAALYPRPEVVVANGVVLRRARADVNAVHFVHGAWLRSPVHTARLQRGPAGWYQALYTRANAQWERAAFDKARVLVAVSERVKAQLVDVGVKPERVRVITNGVDPREFRPGSADRAALGLPRHVPLALFAGDIKSPRKNLDGILRALQRVPELHLAVAGDLERSPFPALAENLGVGRRVHFLGFRRDPAALMRSADIFVLPSRYESSGLVLLEALASGLPVVTARTVGGAAVMPPDCGVVLDDSEDTDGLVAALRALVRDPARRKRMGQAARSVAEQQTWERMAARYLALFAELAGIRYQPSHVES